MSRLGHVLPLTLVFAAACSSTPKPPPAPAKPAQQGAPQAGAQQGEPANAGDFMSQEQERLTLAEQKQSILVEQHITNARTDIENLQLEHAQEELTRALELQPDNLEAKQLMNQVGVLMGKTAAELGAGAKEMQDAYQVQLQQMRADAEGSLQKGQLFLSRGEYDAAIAELTLCLNHMRWAPQSVDWQGLEQEAEKALAKAKSEKASAQKANLDQANREAQAKLKEQEAADRARREAAVANLLDQAIGAFDASKYDQAIEFADQALRMDPQSEKAQEIHDAAFRASRTQVREDYVLAKREQFARWHEELDALKIPWTTEIQLPDQDFWNDITKRRANRLGIEIKDAESASDRELRAQLASTRIPGLAIQQEESLSKVIDVVRTLTGLPLVVDPAAEAAATEAGVVFTLNLQNPLTVEQLLNIVVKQAGENVAWTVKHDAVLVTTKAKARGNLIIHNHDVQDLTFGLTDFLGPRIDRLRLLDDMKDDDGGGPFGGLGESPSPIDIQALKALVQENVAPGTWEEEGVRLDAEQGHLLVVHTPEVQKLVRDFLNELRRFNSSLVWIDSKFMTVASNWIQEIGVDWRGLDDASLDDVTNGLEDQASRGLDNGGTGPVTNAAGSPSAGFFYDDGQDGSMAGHIENFFGKSLGSALTDFGGLTAQITILDQLELSAIIHAVEKSADYQLVNDQTLTVHNTQRAYVAVLNERAYIQDFDVEVAQFQAAADPQVNVLIEGVVLDVRPTIHHNRKYLTLEVQPTVAKVLAIRPFSTTLGGNTSPVEFSLPELEVQSLFTTAVIPDGGSLLLGGLTNVRNVERQAEVPWLADIPIIGFFFKQEGYSDENKTLLILITAHITDVQDELTKLEGRR